MKHCLIIDDQDQEAEIKLLEEKSREQNFPITVDFFNISDPSLSYEEIIDGKPEFLIDEEKVIAKLKEKYGDKEIHLIACDYEYNDRFTDGLKLVHLLKKSNFKGRKMPYLIYSNNFQLVQKKLQGQIQEIVGDEKELMNYLENYFDSKPNSVTDRTAYYEAIIEYLKKNKTPLELRLEAKILEHPDKEFENIFPRFKGKKLRDIANLLRRSTEESDDFESEFIERAVAHFIFLKE